MPTVRRFRITINGKVYEVEAEELGEGTSEPSRVVAAPVTASAPPVAPKAQQGSVSGAAQVEAPLPGLVLDVKVDAGQTVDAGQVLVILEAMKMENEIVAPDNGVVSAVRVSKGDNVSAGDVLVVLE